MYVNQNNLEYNSQTLIITHLSTEGNLYAQQQT